MPVAIDSPPVDINSIAISSPCTVSWDSMKGTDARRHCGQCNLFVHNLEEMTASQVAELLHMKNGRLCARIWRRTDGTIMTADCRKTRREKAAVLARRAITFAAMLLASAAIAVGLSETKAPEKLAEFILESRPVQELMWRLQPQRYSGVMVSSLKE